MTMKSRLLISTLCALTFLPLQANAAAPLLEAPSADAIQEARALVSKMRDNTRGPYSNIQWVCKDGTVLPPKAGACTPHGGGNQYAKFSSDRARLAKLGYPVGTIYMALERPAQAPDARPFLRLRDLPFEQYLTDIDDGWVLHKARSYRGRLQIEDEEQVGRELLLSVLSDPLLTNSDFLLLRELVKVVPHSGAGQDPTREIRRLSQVLAEQNTRFEPLRAEIHGKPTASTAQRVKDWQSRNPQTGERLILLNNLVSELDGIFGEAGIDKRLSALATNLRASDPAIATALTNSTQNRLSNAVETLTKIRQRFDASTNSKTSLLYLDAMTTLEAEIISASRSESAVRLRVDALERAKLLAQASMDLGWLSPTEGDKLVQLLEDISDKASVKPQAYSKAIKNLQLAPAWAQGTVRHTFAESLVKYTALDNRSERFVDDMLRGSVLQPLSELTEQLARDDIALSGLQARFMGKTVNAIALNPGQATGVLRVLSADDEGELAHYDPKDIIVIPNTTSELFPAAGIVTVGEGNPLSHIQILARNLGIPNIVIDSTVRDALKPYDGKRVNFAATQDGRILINLATDSITESKSKLAAPTQISRSGTVPAPIPDLSRKDPLPLSQLRAKLSGVIVGPKAANVGELAYLFPDRVAPAVALPFGAFAENTDAGPGFCVDPYTFF